MSRLIRRSIKRLPCLLNLHRWRDSRSMPEQVCRVCYKRRFNRL